MLGEQHQQDEVDDAGREAHVQQRHAVARQPPCVAHDLDRAHERPWLRRQKRRSLAIVARKHERERGM